MSKPKTHTGVVVTRDGEQKVKLHENTHTWVVNSKEYYYKETGRRGGAGGTRRTLKLDSIKPIGEAL